MQKISLDDISLQILALLQENSRISFVEIGEKVNLSSSSVKERVKKLEETGIIEKYTIKINPKAIGLDITALMIVSFTGVFGFQEKSFVDSISKFPQVIECLRITGNHDFIIKVVVKSIEELKTVNDEVGKFGQVNTSIVVSDFIEHKSIDIQKIIDNH